VTDPVRGRGKTGYRDSIRTGHNQDGSLQTATYSGVFSVCRHLCTQCQQVFQLSPFVLLEWEKHFKNCTHKHRTPLLSHKRTQQYCVYRQVAERVRTHSRYLILCSLHLLSAPWGGLMVRATLDLTASHVRYAMDTDCSTEFCLGFSQFLQADAVQ